MSPVLPRPEDGCGNCITPERSVIAQPYIVRPDGPEGVRAYYRCEGCGSSWYTSRMLGREETERIVSALKLAQIRRLFDRPCGHDFTRQTRSAVLQIIDDAGLLQRGDGAA